jgi:hypothetical protein
MIFVFNANDGSFHHATSVIDKFYGNSAEHVYLDVQDFDLEYEYSYINGEVVKGSKRVVSAEDAAAIEADRLATVHVQPRMNAYPHIREQLDKIYHDIANGSLDATGDFFTAIKTVKDAHPKP